MGILSIRDVQSASCLSYSRADGVFRSPEHLLCPVVLCISNEVWDWHR